MRILLVRSHYELPKAYLPRAINEPAGLEYLASAVRDDHEVQIFDMIAEGWNKYRKADEKGEFFYQGASLKSLQKKIKRFKPDVIGVTWLFSVQNRPVIETVNFIKESNKEIPLIVGGPHPSVNPLEILKENPGIDIIVVGEGEITLKELLDKKLEDLESIDGLAFRKGQEVIQNKPRAFVKNLDDLALPARDLVPYSNYSKQMLYAFLINRFKNRQTAYLLSKIPFLEKLYYKFHNRRHKGYLQQPMADIMSSRGCPNRCIFCAVHIVWKHIWRPHSAEKVLEEIDELVNKYKIKRINFNDDNFNLSKERIIRICQGIVDRKYDITFNAAATYTPTLDDNVLDWLQKAGFKNIRLSIESGNQEVLDKIVRKRIDLKTVPGIVKAAQKRGMVVEGVFIFGLPGETLQTMQDSVDFSKKAGFDIIKYFIFQPFPNTEAYNICKEKGYLIESYNPERIYITGDQSFIKTEEFTPEDVVRIARELDD